MEAPRIGFVGCGEHTTNNLCPALHAAGLDLAAVCDLDKRKAQRVCRLFGAHRSYQDLATMVGEMDLDAVAVCGPPELHAETALEALGHELHVWTESPPAPTVAEARRIADTAAAKGLIVQVGLMMRFAPAYARLAEIISSEDFGQPTMLAAKYCTGKTGGHRQHLLFDALHMIDMARRLMGEVSALCALKCDRAGQVTSAVTLRFESGAVGVLQLSSLQPQVQERVEVSGAGATAIVEGRANLRWRTPAQTDPGEWKTWGPDLAMQDVANSTARLRGYLPALAHFARAVAGEVEPAVTVEDAIAAMELAEAIERCEGEMVEIG